MPPSTQFLWFNVTYTPNQPLLHPPRWFSIASRIPNVFNLVMQAIQSFEDGHGLPGGTIHGKPRFPCLGLELKRTWTSGIVLKVDHDRVAVMSSSVQSYTIPLFTTGTSAAGISSFNRQTKLMGLFPSCRTYSPSPKKTNGEAIPFSSLNSRTNRAIRLPISL